MFSLHGCLLLPALLVPTRPAHAQDNADLLRMAAAEFTAETSRRRDPSGALLPEGPVARHGPAAPPAGRARSGLPGDEPGLLGGRQDGDWPARPPLGDGDWHSGLGAAAR